MEGWRAETTWKDIPNAKVPSILRRLYPRIAVLTDVLDRLPGMSEDQKQRCRLGRSTTDSFVVAARDEPFRPIQQNVRGMDYNRFKALVNGIQWNKGDVFAFRWFKCSFREVFFERKTFEGVFDAVGPVHSMHIIADCVLFERIAKDKYIQWTGPRASQKQLLPVQPIPKAPPAARRRPNGRPSLSNLYALKAATKPRKKQSSRPLDVDFRTLTNVDTATMVYGGTTVKKLRNTYLLGSPANVKNALALGERIFGKDLWKTQAAGLTLLHRVLKKLLKNHRMCKYRELLDEHCPTSMPKTEPAIVTVGQLCGMYHESKEVVAFLYAVLLRLLPDDLLGTKSNWRHLMKNLASLAKIVKGEVVHLSRFTRGIRLNGITWLGPVEDASMRDQMMRILVAWCANLVVCLLRAHFYVTDTKKMKRKLIFFRRTTWKTLNTMWCHQCGMFSVDTIEDPQFSGRARLLPKDATNVRMVVLTKRSSAPVLRTTQALLASMKTEEPEDLFTRWKNYVCHWNSMGKPKVFFVKADIEDCFGSIDHVRALIILSEIFKKTEKQRVVLDCEQLQVINKTRLVKTRVQFGAWKTLTKPLEHSPRRGQVVKVLVPYQCITPSKEKVSKLIEDYVTRFHVSVCGRNFKITRGVPQGGVLSADIADLYLEAMTAEHLSSFVRTPADMLLRSMDDFLYVTSDRDAAERFFNRFRRHFADYGLYSKSAKIETNVETSCSKPQRYAHYCGLTFDSETLEVFHDSRTLQDPVYTVGHCDVRQGLALKRFLEPYSLIFTPLELDCAINSERRLVQNISNRVGALADMFFFAVRQMKFVNERYVSKVLLGTMESFLAQMMSFRDSGLVELSLDLEDMQSIFLLTFRKKAPACYREIALVVKRRLLAIKKRKRHYRVKELQAIVHGCLNRRC